MSVLFLFFFTKYHTLYYLVYLFQLTAISPCSLEALICLSLILQILDVITFSLLFIVNVLDLTFSL